MQIPKIESISDLHGCVFKLFWGDAYIIVKCNQYNWYKNTIEQALYYYLTKNKPDKLYNRFFGYIRLHPDRQFLVKILFKSDSQYQLLVREQQELDKAKGDSNCFNTSFDAYTPKGIQGRIKAHKSPISRGTYLNFMKWKKNRQPKPLSDAT